MDDQNQRSLRIDWFDGTLVEQSRSNFASTSEFDDEDKSQQKAPTKSQIIEKKPIGFKRLLDISLMQPSILPLEVSNRPGFWMLLDTELKGDYIVLIVKILANVYNVLEPDENSKITSMLKSKFITSKFFDSLKEYLKSLPNVRIVDKRMNSQLWDDIQTFYFNVVLLCKGIINYHNNDLKLLLIINDLLDVTETSVIGVKVEHRETFRDELFEEIIKIKSSIKPFINESIEDERGNKNLPEDPNSFRKLSIFPSKQDLLTENHLNIQPNIVKGAYPDVEHYLDLQFKLMREDCFGPLREGLNKYLQNPSKRRYENIRVYPKVRVIRTYVSKNVVGHLVDIAWADRANDALIGSKRYAQNKHLMFGSLLLFTNDNFDSILCATVLDSNNDLLCDGFVAVQFQNPISNNIYSNSFLMVESELFFEPYHRVLKVLQSYRYDLPMRKYIVDVQTEVRPPVYLTEDSIYSVLQPNSTTDELSFPVLDLNKWPTSDFVGLDESQMEAYKFALTREFAVIQGPPGTGKTYIGTKIASTILANLSLEGTPMLVICYTNHALDQFLEGILKVTENIVRLGNQSKSQILQSLSLQNLRTKRKSKYSYLYASKKAELQTIFQEITDLQTEIEKCENKILSYSTLKKHLKIGNKSYTLKTSNGDPVSKWLFDDSNDDVDTVDDSDDWEKRFDDIDIDVEDEKITTCFSVQWAQKQIETIMNSIDKVKDISGDESEIQKTTDRLKAEINIMRDKINCFKKYIHLGHDKPSAEENIKQVENLYQLTLDQRWKLYFRCAGAIKSNLMNKMDVLLDRHNTCSKELEEASTIIDGEVIKTARVVGVTTSTAARRHDLMKKLHSPIVIVEEAAEVLEAHIVASLTRHCQHLILIGDHKQLRPTAAHYKLAKDYNLEISLFERMIRNGIHARTLTTQRRMRTNMAALLVPIIYDQLDCHPRVSKYPDVRGIKDNLYFCTHNTVEDTEGMEDSWSHKNCYEAKWCVGLANYLRKMNYKAEEITILATYTGQVSILQELAHKDPALRGVKITAVDSYQGRENRIIILSLVRSNKDNNIGFLAATNRICVMLSRAKEGFYIFGNMDVLKSASAIWRSINDKLISQQAIGRKVRLRCETHKEVTLEISNPEDFENTLERSCLKICKRKKKSNNNE